MLLRGVNRHVRYAALKATGDAELLRQTEMKHHPTCTPRPDARAAGVLAESWSSKDSTRGLSLQNCPPPPHPQTTPNCAAQTRCIVGDKAHRRVEAYHYASQHFFFLFNSLFELLVVCCFKKKKKSRAATSPCFHFFFFLPFLVVKI